MAFIFAPAALGVRSPAVPKVGRMAGAFGGVRVVLPLPPTCHTTAAADVAVTVASATPGLPAAPLTRRALLRTASAAAAVAAVAATGVAGTRPRVPAGVSPTPTGLPVAPVPLWVRTVAPMAAAPTAVTAAAPTASLPLLPVLVFTDAAAPEGYTATHECASSAGRAVTSVAAAAPSSSSPTAVAAAALAADIGRGAQSGGAAAAAAAPPPPQVHVVGGGGAAARAAVAYAAAVGRVGVASLTLEAPRLGADAPSDDAAWEAVLADVYRPTGATAAAAGVPLGATASGGWTVVTPAAAAGPAAVAAVDAAVPAGDYRAALADLTAAGLPVAVVRSAMDADVTVWVANVPAEGAAPRADPWACVGAAGGMTRTEAWGGWHSAASAERAAFVAALSGMYDRIERA
ncbi:hypothetical protein MMPV_005254 [Pyropia vietnamensis]